MTNDPFASVWDEASLSLQRQLLQLVTSVARSRGIALYLDSGTLLGHVRHGSILPWDDDLDLALPDAERAGELRAALAWAGLKSRIIASETFIKVYDPAYPNAANLPWTWPFIDIFVFHQKSDKLIGSWPTLTLPRELVLPGRMTTFEAAQCWEPERPLAVLDTMYPGWRIRETTGPWNHREHRVADWVASRHVRTNANGRRVQHDQSIMHLTRIARSGRPFLVIVRAGDQSLHKRWMKQGAARQWDLMVNYPDDRDCEDDFADILAIGGAAKYPAIKDIYYAEKSLLSGRLAVLFLDDGVELAFEDLDRIFALFMAHGLWLAQPSWTHDSHASWKVTLNCPLFELHYTNLVEGTAPIFSQHALAVCIDSFDQSISGEGLNFVWSKLLDHPCDRVAVIDAVTMRNTHESQQSKAALHRYLHSLGIDHQQEMAAVLANHGIQDVDTRLYGFVMRSGDRAQKIMLTN